MRTIVQRPFSFALLKCMLDNDVAACRTHRGMRQTPLNGITLNQTASVNLPVIRPHWLLAAALCLLPLSSPAQNELPTVKMLIASLENCQSWEPYCVRILRRDFLGQGVVQVKAQIRGGRIFWYRVNRRSGEVLRLN